MSLSCLLLVMGLTLLIPLGRGPVIRADVLPCLPSMGHGEVFRGFYVSIFPRKKKVTWIGVSSALISSTIFITMTKYTSKDLEITTLEDLQTMI
jgi:hypothetical protein